VLLPIPTFPQTSLATLHKVCGLHCRLTTVGDAVPYTNTHGTDNSRAIICRTSAEV